MAGSNPRRRGRPLRLGQRLAAHAAHDVQKDSEKVLPYRALSYAGLVDHFVDAVGSAELAENVLQDNPARLYGFA